MLVSEGVRRGLAAHECRNGSDNIAVLRGMV